MPRWFIAAWEWLQGSDPGLSRLRMAGSAAAAITLALGVELVFAIVVQVSPKGRLVAMILGALVAMLGSMALIAVGDNARVKIITTLFFPCAIGAGMLLGVVVGGHTDLMLGVFVLVMFAAVWVRRFGVAYFFYGFMFWLGYFFAAFLNARLSMLPLFMEAIVLSSALVLLLSLTIFQVNPARTLQRTINAFDARARAVVRACSELLDSPAQDHSRTSGRLRRRIHGQERRLAEAALIVEGRAAEPAALPSGQAAATLRRQLIGAQQALDALVATTEVLSVEDNEFRTLAKRIARQLARRDDRDAVHSARKLMKISKRHNAESGETHDQIKLRRSAYRFARATIVFALLARAAQRRRFTDSTLQADRADAFEPTAGLVMGNLPGSAAVAKGLPARGARWNVFARLDLTSRQAIQVAIAGALAIIAGRALSPTRYYWAVIAAFIMFSGTATRSETLLKGFNRVIGTALGLTVAVGLAELTAGHTVAIVVTIVLSMFCGLYMVRVGYAYTIFFMTIMVAQLYTVLHEFTPGLLMLRLEETAIGAGLGFVVALLLIPLSTRDTAGSARKQALEGLATLLDAAADHLSRNGSQEDIDQSLAPDANSDKATSLHVLSRQFDDRVRRLALVTRPLTIPLVGGRTFLAARHRLNYYAAAATSARLFIVTLDEIKPTSDPIDRRLIDATRALAAAAAHLATIKPSQAGSDMSNLLSKADAALSGIPPSVIQSSETEYLIESLRHLIYLLRELSSPASLTSGWNLLKKDKCIARQ